MHSRELAELFLRKSRQDEFVLDKLISDPTSPDEVIGFHAQQAVEKMLKAVLALRAVRFGKVHQIGHLLALLHKNNLAYPSEFEELDQLTPFAAELRYQDLLAASGRSFDRVWVREMISRVKAWAESVLRGTGTE